MAVRSDPDGGVAGGITVENTLAPGWGSHRGRRRVVVESDLSITGRPDAFAIGDAAAVPWGPGADEPGKVCPARQVAIQSGAHAAHQILNGWRAVPPGPSGTATRGSCHHRATGGHYPSSLEGVVRGTLGCSPGSDSISSTSSAPEPAHRAGHWSWRYLSWARAPGSSWR